MDVSRAEKTSPKVAVSDALKAALSTQANSGEQNPATSHSVQESDARKEQPSSEEKSKPMDQMKSLERRGRKRKSRGKSTFLDNLWDLAGQGSRLSKSSKTSTGTL